MRAFTDLFIKHPVLAIVVNIAIVLVGIRALSSLPVQQFPSVESSSVIITTVYTGASAETVRAHRLTNWSSSGPSAKVESLRYSPGVGQVAPSSTSTGLRRRCPGTS